jgi:hypothetical protein
MSSSIRLTPGPAAAAVVAAELLLLSSTLAISAVIHRQYDV